MRPMVSLEVYPSPVTEGDITTIRAEFSSAIPVEKVTVCKHIKD